MKIDYNLAPADLEGALKSFWNLSGAKILAIAQDFDPAKGAPVFTVRGRYTTRGWTEWTQGFQFGAAILQYDATRDRSFLELGRHQTVEHMAPHLTHTGVHDHGFNNLSTYGNLLRLMDEGQIREQEWERHFYELALKVSGAVQAARWTRTADGRGFIHSFNGPHSLFSDTIRSLRALAVAHQLGHVLMGEMDRKIPLMERLLDHAHATARYNVFYGEGRDIYDVRGRVVHESIFNTTDGNYRCPSSQQGFSPFSTWTRGLAWVMLGFAELLEFFEIVPEEDVEGLGGRKRAVGMMLKAAKATCDFYIYNAAEDGVPYWDTGAPGLAKLGDFRNQPADPFNDQEPVDSSAAAIAAQGLLRLGHYLIDRGDRDGGRRYFQAGLTVARTLLGDPYISAHPDHQGLLLHSVYHRPNGWDAIPKGARVPFGESSMWGDYHIRETALYLARLAKDEPYLAFFLKKRRS